MNPITRFLSIIAALSMGYYFGLQTAGRLAYQGPEMFAPEWVATVQTMASATLAVLLVSLIAATAVHRLEQQAADTHKPVEGGLEE